MKTLHLAILAVTGLFLVLTVAFHTVNAFCGELNSDWIKAPCYAIPGLNVTKEQMKNDWAGYYQYKGAQWMEAKKIEMANYTSNNLLKTWTCVNQSNYDVWWYYYLNDQAPSIAWPENGPMCNIPPLQQLKVGKNIGEIDCGYDQYLLVNNKTGMPACINLSSIPKILERGWSHLATYLDKTTFHSPLISTVSITEQDLPSCQSCEGKSENLTVTIGTNNTVRWVNNTPYSISFFTLPDNADIAFSNSATFPTGGHIGAMRFPAYLYSGQSFEYTFTKAGKFMWHTHPQLLGWVTVLPQQLQLAAINQTSQMTEFNGVIVDQSLDARHFYSLYTNDTSEKFNIGSNGISLEGLNNIDGLDGKYIKIFGTLVQVPHNEDEIRVDTFQIIGSLVPKANPTRNMSQQITLEELYSNPDKYYNQTVTITGQLREYDYPIAYAGVGCSSAQFTTSDIFVPDFVSRHQLYDGQNYIGVRIGGSDDVGYSPTERLPADLKNKSVSVTGIFVPEIHDTGMCMHVLHKSGYLLTDFSKIQPTGG